MTDLEPTSGAKMLYLIKRRSTTSRDELVANWFANHMPAVIESQHDGAQRGRLHAWRYLATLFGPAPDGSQDWDGVAALWWDKALPMPDEPFGDPPRDTFQAKAEPYWPWATTEYVALDGHLPVEPNSLNEAYPCTRSGLTKVTTLVAAQPGSDIGALHAHWLDVHTPNGVEVMKKVGGFRYVISLSLDPAATYAGMAELYFDSPDGHARFLATIEPDGMAQWVDPSRTRAYPSDTEMIGIP